MWCQVGNKDQRLVFSPITLDTNPHRASYLYWDLDRTGQLPATPDPHHLFYVSIPGPGLPYMMHEIYTEEYFIRTWYQEQYEPQFWAVRHRMPTMIENAYWNQDDQRVRFCTHYEEAFWAYPQGWIFGSGEISHGGLPSGNGVVYGSHESQAKFLTPQWLTKVTSPVEWCQASLFLESKS